MPWVQISDIWFSSFLFPLQDLSSFAMPFLENEERSASDQRSESPSSPAPDSESIRRYTFPNNATKPVSTIEGVSKLSEPISLKYSWKDCYLQLQLWMLSELYIHIQIPQDWLCRFHITKYWCGFCKLQYHWGYYEGTLQPLNVQ